MKEYDLAKMIKDVDEWKQVKFYEDNEIRIKYRKKGSNYFIYKSFKNVVPSDWTDIYLDNQGLLTIQYTKEVNELS